MGHWAHMAGRARNAHEQQDKGGVRGSVCFAWTVLASARAGGKERVTDGDCLETGGEGVLGLEAMRAGPGREGTNGGPKGGRTMQRIHSMVHMCESSIPWRERVCMGVRSCVDAFVYACVRIYMCGCVCVCTRGCVCVCMLACVHGCSIMCGCVCVRMCSIGRHTKGR